MTTIETLAAVLGGFATFAALIYAMLGSPDLLKFMRREQRHSSLDRRRAERRVAKIDWGQLEAAASAFATKSAVTYDLVVGVQPDGISLANLLAGRLQIRYAAIDKHYPQSKRTSFFVFDPDRYTRSVRASVTQFSPPSDIVNPSRILIVDGVTTFGNALLKAEEEVLKKFSNTRIDFYVFAVDQPRLAACHPEIVDRVAFHVAIDNYSIWLHFPWDPE